MTVAAVVGVVSIARSAPTTDTTAVDFVAIPAKQVWGGNSIPAGRTESVVVIGGSTTVPSNATTVRLEVTVKGSAAGTIDLFPAGNPSGGSGHSVPWAAGGTSTVTSAENVGMSNKVSVKNNSSKAAVVTIRIIGYSTQVTAGSINGSGGTAGEVLTNTGAGADWQVPGRAYAVSFAGTATAPPGTSYAPLTLPAGTYLVTFTASVSSSQTDNVGCHGKTPHGVTFGSAFGSTSFGNSQHSVTFTRLVTLASGGDLRVQCVSNGSVSISGGYLVAQRVGLATGGVFSSASQANQSQQLSATTPR